jgi:hypothetical protein
VLTNVDPKIANSDEHQGGDTIRLTHQHGKDTKTTRGRHCVGASEKCTMSTKTINDLAQRRADVVPDSGDRGGAMQEDARLAADRVAGWLATGAAFGDDGPASVTAARGCGAPLNHARALDVEKDTVAIATLYMSKVTVDAVRKPEAPVNHLPALVENDTVAKSLHAVVKGPWSDDVRTPLDQRYFTCV